jgi:hypothetical protein
VNPGVAVDACEGCGGEPGCHHRETRCDKGLRARQYPAARLVPPIGSRALQPGASQHACHQPADNRQQAQPAAYDDCPVRNLADWAQGVILAVACLRFQRKALTGQEDAGLAWSSAVKPPDQDG